LGFFSQIFFPYGIILQAIAIVHFIRRRPDGYWLWIVLFGGGLGALVYIVVEVIPDAGLLREGFKVFPRRGRINELRALVEVNPAPANMEELGALYLEDGKYQKALECFDRAIASRADSIDTFYRRGLAEMELQMFALAIVDFERVVKADPKYDFHRAAGMLAHAYAKTGQTEKADAQFQRVMAIATSSELQYYYAEFLASQGRKPDANEWVAKILSKKKTMPAFQKRRERPWFRKASGLQKQIGAAV
jgi:hypothetical protein